jgi:hypothetical protein
MKVLTVRLNATDTVEVHLLNVGEKLANFDGSRHDFQAGYDFRTGRKNRPASLILRQHGLDGFHDRELSITEPAFWTWIGKRIGA